MPNASRNEAIYAQQPSKTRKNGTNGLAINGLGISPAFHGHGGNALLYAELANTIREFGAGYCEMREGAEPAIEMRSDLEKIGGVPAKNHQVCVKQLTKGMSFLPCQYPACSKHRRRSHILYRLIKIFTAKIRQ